MCAQSVVMDYMQHRVPLDYWTRPVFNEYQEVIRRLEELDKKLGQPDCVDPEKDAFMERIEERLRSLEEKVGV